MKHLKEKQGSHKKKIIISLSVIFVVAAVIAVTVFAFYQSSFAVNNEIKLNQLKVDLVENFEPPENWNTTDPITKEVNYTNSGSIPAYIRVQMSETWIAKDNVFLSTTLKDKNGQVLDVVVKNWDANYGLNNPANWTFKDGWYYFNKALSPQQTIQILKSIQINGSADLTIPTGYKEASYQLSFLHEFVEADGTKTAALWGRTPTVAADGAITWS